MSRSEREIALLRRLLAIMAYRLGGEVRLTEEEAMSLAPAELAKKLKIKPEHVTRPWELGMDDTKAPTVITGFPGKSE
jgi:hypothetical protein